MSETPADQEPRLAPVDAREDGDVLGPTCKRYGFMIAIAVLAYGAAIHRRAPAHAGEVHTGV